MAPPPAGPIPPRQEPSALRREVSGSSIPIVQRVLAAGRVYSGPGKRHRREIALQTLAVPSK